MTFEIHGGTLYCNISAAYFELFDVGAEVLLKTRSGDEFEGRILFAGRYHDPTTNSSRLGIEFEHAEKYCIEKIPLGHLLEVKSASRPLQFASEALIETQEWEVEK